jgi:hypothetical protein
VLFNDASVDGVLNNKDVIPVRPYLKSKGIDLAKHRDRTDKEFSKKIRGKYGKLDDEETLEGA